MEELNIYKATAYKGKPEEKFDETISPAVINGEEE